MAAFTDAEVVLFNGKWKEFGKLTKRQQDIYDKERYAGISNSRIEDMLDANECSGLEVRQYPDMGRGVAATRFFLKGIPLLVTNYLLLSDRYRHLGMRNVLQAMLLCVLFNYQCSVSGGIAVSDCLSNSGFSAETSIVFHEYDAVTTMI